MPAVYYQMRDVLEGTYTLRILDGSFALAWSMAPYLLVTLLLGVVATRSLRGRLSGWFVVRNVLLAIPVAAALGVLSPLPTYAAVALGVSVMPLGLPFGALIAFTVASPLMNPGIFYLTAARLGLEMAVVRTASAFLVGCAAGFLAHSVFRSLGENVRVPGDERPPRQRTLQEDVVRAFRYNVRVFGIAILISAAVKALVPAQTLIDVAGSHATAGTLVAMGLGIPFYTCGGAAIPLVETLMSMGMGKGPVLAFFIAGPATKLETIYAVRTTMGTRVLVFYVILTFCAAFVAGLMYSSF